MHRIKLWPSCLLALLLSCVLLTTQADQTSPELPGLFADLSSAANSSEAAQLENDIWQLWLQAPDADSDALMSQIVYAMQDGRLALAIKLCDQLIDSHPGYAEAWNKRATVHYMAGNLDASVNDIQQTIKLEPKHFGAISGLGLIFLKRGRLQDALAAFEQVLVISPKSANTLRSIEQVRDRLGDEI